MTFDEGNLKAACILCPDTKQKLHIANSELLKRVNEAILHGLVKNNAQVKNNAGQSVEQPLIAALVREDQKLLFPITNDIPNMVMDRAIRLGQLSAD